MCDIFVKLTNSLNSGAINLKPKSFFYKWSALVQLERVGDMQARKSRFRLVD